MNMEWQSIETAPKNNSKIFVVKAFGVILDSQVPYTSDPYCVWHDGDKFVRWPHDFSPTHWMPLPEAPK